MLTYLALGAFLNTASAQDGAIHVPPMGVAGTRPVGVVRCDDGTPANIGAGTVFEGRFNRPTATQLASICAGHQDRQAEIAVDQTLATDAGEIGTIDAQTRRAAVDDAWSIGMIDAQTRRLTVSGAAGATHTDAETRQHAVDGAISIAKMTSLDFSTLTPEQRLAMTPEQIAAWAAANDTADPSVIVDDKLVAIGPAATATSMYRRGGMGNGAWGAGSAYAQLQAYRGGGIGGYNVVQRPPISTTPTGTPDATTPAAPDPALLQDLEAERAGSAAASARADALQSQLKAKEAAEQARIAAEAEANNWSYFKPWTWF